MSRIATRLCALLAVWIGSPIANAADAWNLDKEKLVQFQAKVVDLACALGKTCPPDCGAGKRQLGLLTADGKLLPAAKGATPFAGAVANLLPYCGKSVMVDGLLIEKPEMTLFFVQYLRERADEPWKPAEAFQAQWTAKHGEAAEWFRADPLVKETVADDGILGIKGLK